MSCDLTRKETSDLEKLENVIAKGVGRFLAVGKALMEIRDRRLYRTEYATFEEYCRLRWHFSRQRGLQFIEAEKLGQRLSEAGVDLTTIVVNEGQARELAGDLAAPTGDEVKDAEAVQAAVETWTAKEKAKRVRSEEKAAIAHAANENGPKAALEQGVRTLFRAKKIFQKVGPAAGSVIDVIEQALKEAAAVVV